MRCMPFSCHLFLCTVSLFAFVNTKNQRKQVPRIHIESFTTNDENDVTALVNIDVYCPLVDVHELVLLVIPVF